MILESLRAALILGTILANGIAFASPPQQNPDVKKDASPKPTQPSIETALLPRLEKVIAPVANLGHGLASWYGRALDRHRTASGELFDSEKLTAASNTLALGSRVKVTNLKNGRSVVVYINDRGILSAGRIIDLSKAAADQIGLLRMGVAPVSLESLAIQ